MVVWTLFVGVICLSFIGDAKAKTVEGTVSIDGMRAIATTDENFICATLDLWPSSSCNFGSCSWGNASFLNVDLENQILFNAIKEFSPLRIRLGGTLQDRLIYQTGDRPCTPFVLNTSQLYDFTEGCLPLARWDELNSFFNRTGAHITFGINALNGKTIPPNNTGTATGQWDYWNAASFIHYTVEKGYNIVGWEYGNELGGVPIVGVGVPPSPYASETIALHNLLRLIYGRAGKKPPLILAPGGIFESAADWFTRYINESAGSLNVISHHIYNIGSGGSPDGILINNILNATFLDEVITVYKGLHDILENSSTSTVAWISESGGVFGSGRNGVTNTFVSGFWYLDQLGIASIYDTKVWCRQTLVGGNYGLLNTTTFVPNPDYYGALLWHRLMGRTVLLTKFQGTKNIRAYAHCAKQSTGISVLFLNLDGNTTVQVGGLIDATYFREEYHLTPTDGNIQSRAVSLNGKPLTVDSCGSIPALKPMRVFNSESITVNPHSIVFVHFPNAFVPACSALWGSA